MMGELSGGCVCGAVRYTLKEGFRFKPYACHCKDCQSRTGSAFSEHMFFAKQDLLIEGELDEGTYLQPSGAKSSILGCKRCKGRIFAENSTRPGFGSLRCGTLDRSREVIPVAHLWVRSKQPWVQIPDGARQLDEQPESPEEWMKLVG